MNPPARKLLRNAQPYAVICLVLALGIGASVAVLSIGNATLFRPLGVSNPNELLWVRTHFEERGVDRWLVPYANLKDLEAASDSFSGLAIAQDVMAELGRGRESARLLGAAVTPNYFALLGVRLSLGRGFLVTDNGVDAPPVVVLSEELFRLRFGGDRGVVGRTVFLSGEPFDVVGVCPRGFEGLSVGPRPQFWIPVQQIGRLLDHSENLFSSRGAFFFNGIVRLAPGIGIDRAQAQTQAIGQRLAVEHRENAGRSLSLAPLDEADRWMWPAAALVAAAGAVLYLVACANAANLWLLLFDGRRQEMVVRRALGASRLRIAGSLLLEAGLVCLFAAGVGTALGSFSIRFLLLEVPLSFPLRIEVRPDAYLVGAGVVLGLGTVLLVGLYPSLQLSKDDLFAELRSSSRRLGSRALVVTQVALSLTTLVVAGLLVRSFQRALSANLGFDAEKVAVLSLDLRAQGYDVPRARGFQENVLSRVRALPGVESASLATHVPLWWEPSLGAGFVSAEGTKADPEIFTARAVVGADYFRTLGIPLQEGRGFVESDDEASPSVVIVSESLAKRLSPQGNVVGRVLSFRGSTPGMGLLGSEDGQFEIVGVASDASHLSVGKGIRFAVYVPLAQHPSTDVALHLRTEGDTTAVLSSALAVVRSMDDELPFRIALPLSGIVGRALFAERIGAKLTSVFGLATLVLASLGIYGVLARATSERTREFGVRMTLGASARQILGLVLRQGMGPVSVGVLVGLVVSGATSQLLSSLLFEVSPSDPSTYVAIVVLVGTVSLIACFAPAWRAARVHPSVVLRHE